MLTVQKEDFCLSVSLAWLVSLGWLCLQITINSPDCTAHDAVADITIIHFLLEGTNLAPSLSRDTAGPDGCNINTNQARSVCLMANIPS